MASTSVTISNTKEAIANGTIPGSFTDDRTSFMFPTLTYEGARGALHQWSVKITLLRSEQDRKVPVPITDDMLVPAAVLPEDYIAEIINISQQIGGKVRDVIPTYLSKGLNLGKKNATNALTQAIRDALGQYNKHKRRTDGAERQPAVQPAVPEKKESKKTKTIAPKAPEINLRPPPQLIKSASDAPLTLDDFAEGVTVQRKLNGVRFVAAAAPIDAAAAAIPVIRYSRSGLDYPGQNTIAGELDLMFKAWARRLADPKPFTEAIEAERATNSLSHIYLDGELYQHGETLNQISGQARRADVAADPSLSYNIFDVFLPVAKAANRDMASRDRQTLVDEFFAASAGPAHPHVVRVENFTAADQAAVNEYAKQFLTEGYEGAIARRDAAGYRYSQNGYHSANALKIKPTHDAEFTVIGYGQGGKGKEIGAVLWVCEVPEDKAVDLNDRIFTVVPKNMTYAERYQIYKCLGSQVPSKDDPKTSISRFDRDVKGLPLTVEFKETSPTTGKPLQAKALAFRTYESGPDADPIARLLRECT